MGMPTRGRKSFYITKEPCSCQLYAVSQLLRLYSYVYISGKVGVILYRTQYISNFEKLKLPEKLINQQ